MAKLGLSLLEKDTRLTPREKDIIRYLAAGKTDQDIAEALCITLRAVQAHLQHIREKLYLPTTSRLALLLVYYDAVEKGEK